MDKLKEIDWGKKMIKVSVQFWTNNLPTGTDTRTAWGSGSINLVANKQRGIEHDDVFFNSLEEFFPKLHELCKRNKVKLIKPERYSEIDISRVERKEKVIKLY